MRRSFVTFQAEDRLEEVVKGFARHNITSAPVLDGSEFIGFVSDIGISEYFIPKKFGFIWKKEKTVSFDEVRKITARHLAKKSAVILKPDQKLVNALPLIVKRPYDLPVIDNGKLVGVIGGYEITAFFLKELVKGTVDVPGTENLNMGTEVDRIYQIVQTQGEITANKVATEIGISLKSVEKICDALEKHHLIEMKSTFFKGTVLRRPGYGKK